MAVLGVLLSHFWLEHFEFGHLGVRLFFVLSGFLITSQLLDGPPLAQFYLRRSARLLPAFYAAILLAWVGDIYGFRETWPWHVAQFTNLYVALNEGWGPVWPVGHFWTLNVEAQFYLIWPLAILLISKSKHVAIIWLMIAIGPSYRAFILANDIHELYFLLPFAQFDALGMGALLAVAPKSRVLNCGFLGLPFAIGGVLSFYFDSSVWVEQTFELFALLLLAPLVAAAFQGRLWLSGRILPDIGKISYGIYLYHEIFYAIALRYFELPLSFATFLVISCCTVAISWVSFHYFEAPVRDILNRKISEYYQGGSAGKASS